jgi:hypothetical protein
VRLCDNQKAKPSRGEGRKRTGGRGQGAGGRGPGDGPSRDCDCGCRSNSNFKPKRGVLAGSEGGRPAEQSSCSCVPLGCGVHTHQAALNKSKIRREPPAAAPAINQAVFGGSAALSVVRQLSACHLRHFLGFQRGIVAGGAPAAAARAAPPACRAVSVQHQPH